MLRIREVERISAIIRRVVDMRRYASILLLESLIFLR